MREGLQNNSENAHLSKDLVTIDINVELNCNLAELKRTELDIEALSELYQQFEFSGLLKQLPNFQVETIPDYDEPVKYF